MINPDEQIDLPFSTSDLIFRQAKFLGYTADMDSFNVLTNTRNANRCDCALFRISDTAYWNSVALSAN